MSIDETERQKIKDYVIGTTKLSYPNIEKDEIDLLLDDLDAVIDGTFVPYTEESIRERLEKLRKKDKDYPPGDIIIICDPSLKAELNFKYKWGEIEKDAPKEYGFKINVHTSDIELSFMDGNYCRINVSPNIKGELLNQLISLIRGCGETDSGINYSDFCPTFNKSEFRYISVNLEDKTAYKTAIDELFRIMPDEITLFTNGDLSFNDMNNICRVFDNYDINIRLCWRYTQEYGEKRAAISLFIK